MTRSESQQPSISQLLSPATRLGHVHLTVADLEGQFAFYQDVLGLQLHWREGTTVGLGAGKEDLVRLTEVRGARRVRSTTGLYHFALEYPSRRELARSLARLFALHYRHYPTDHVVSKTTYLDDPEGQNIELYIPSPEDGTYTVRNGVYDFAPSSPSQFEHRESMLVCCSSTNHPDKQKENRQEDKRLAPRLIKRSDQENKRFFVRLIVENKQEGSHISA